MASEHKLLKQAVGQGHLRPLDRYLAEQLMQLGTTQQIDTLLAIALTSRAAGDGHVCLELSAWAGQPIFFDNEQQRPLHQLPQLEAWRQQLLDSGIVGRDGAATPQALVLDGEDRLYLARYHDYEQRIETQIGRRLQSVPVGAAATLRQRLQSLFPDSDIRPDQQKLAAALAMLQPFCVISGGPGTGKTTTVTRILALYLQQNQESQESRIALVAPTGKAAARLTESIRGAKQKLTGVDGALLAQIPEQATTVHRLLKPLRNSSQFRHNADNPLHLDLLIVDEASMLDVPLMAKLVTALPDHCRIILLGDRDQLASVEAGSVFSDLCNRGAAFAYSEQLLPTLTELDVELPVTETEHRSAMADSVAVLTYSHRFGSDSGIGQLARAINRGDSDTALQVCEEFDDARLAELLPEQLPAQLGRRAIKGFAAYLQAGDARAALAAFADYRILCALREGAYGVQEINGHIEKGLQGAGLIDTTERYYPGRPLMIRANDYNLQLYNGDIGICLPDPEAEGRIRVFFEDAEGTLRSILPSRLPEHETAYAMTVHKSQGSEFEACLLVLPQRDAAVLTRELIYTGVTRAKDGVEIWCGDVGVFRASIERRVERHSGLFGKLWG